MDSTNYAAPNTPIASSKRPRISTKSIRSPSLQQAKQVVVSVDRSDSKEYTRKINHKICQPPISLVPPTPSKNLFSPTLRTDSQLTCNSVDSCEAVRLLSDEDSVEIEAKKINMNGTIEESDGKNREEVDEEIEDDVFNPYHFIAGLPPHSVARVLDKVCLPSNINSTQKITLVLDLDETLVHCTVEPIENPDLVFPVSFNGNMYQVYVRKRPYLDYFLETVSKSFEVVVFTASQKVYADVLLDQIDPNHKYINHRLFREACLLVQGNYLKDLTVIQRDLNKTVLVDNSPHAYGYQIDNGIPIESWYDDESDTELLKLIGFLKRVNDVNDVRPILRDHFKTYQLVANAKAGLPPVLTAPPF